MSHCYNVVWADDEIDSLYENYHKRFERKGIIIFPFSDAKSAIDHIRKHPKFVDGIIVDAKFSINGGPVDETSPKTPGLSRFIHSLDAMRAETGMPLPCWIFTGYGELLSKRYNEDDLEPFEDVISKSANYSDIGAWLDDMCAIISQTKNEVFKLRQEYAELFSMCTDNYLGEEKAAYLINILEYDKKGEGVPPFNSIRMLLESTLTLLQRRGVITGTFRSQIAIGEKAKWLRDNNWDGESSKMPNFVIDSFIMLAHNSTMSHSEDKEEPNSYDSQEFYQGRATYMFPLMLNALKTILLWIKYYLDTTPHPIFTSKNMVSQQNANSASSDGTIFIPEENQIPSGYQKARLDKITLIYKFKLDNGESAVYYPKSIEPATQIGDSFIIKLRDDKTSQGDWKVEKASSEK